MADLMIQQLPPAAPGFLTDEDLLVIVQDVSTSPVTRKVDFQDLVASIEVALDTDSKYDAIGAAAAAELAANDYTDTALAGYDTVGSAAAAEAAANGYTDTEVAAAISTANNYTDGEVAAKEDAFSKGTLAAGKGVTMSGTLSNRLVGSGTVTVSATDPVGVLTNSSGTVTVDCSTARSFTITLAANVTTLTLSNLAGAGFATEIEIEITQNGTGGFTFALPASFKALGGSDTAIASAPNSVTILSAKTFDNGTTWRYAMQESA